MAPMASDHDEHAVPARVGLLYPTRNAGEDDYEALAAQLNPAPQIAFAYVAWGEGVSQLDALDAEAKLAALREVGERHRLLAAAEQFDSLTPEVVSWTCSSCSFLWGVEGAQRQADALTEQLGVPASSTSLAFLAAAHTLGLTRIGLGSVYSSLVTDAFVAFLASAGIETVHRVALDAGSDREVAAWGTEKMLQIAQAANHPRADAVLIPETALHTTGCLDELEHTVGKPVLTATHVTMWDALRQSGRYQPRPGLGALFAAA